MTTHSHEHDRGDVATGATVETTLISLDGHVDDPMRFAMAYFDADAQADALELLDAHDAIVFGRRTFEALGTAWAGQSGEFADRINAIRKYVVSSTLTEAEWTNSHGGQGTQATARTRPGDLRPWRAQPHASGQRPYRRRPVQRASGPGGRGDGAAAGPD